MASSTLVSLFFNGEEAEAAIRNLKHAGFTEEEIGLIMQDPGKPDLHHESLAGGLLSLLGSLLIPGLGPLLLGGVLASVLTGAGTAGANGGLAGILAGLGVPTRDAEHFERGVRAGGVLLTVDAGERISEVRSIVENHGGYSDPDQATTSAAPHQNPG